MRNDVKFSVAAVELFERPVRLRLPFRFGAATLREAPQAFVRARIRLTDGREAFGWSAEMMIPKWFDKSPQRSDADNLADLRRSLAIAAEAYRSNDAARVAFGHTAIHYPALMEIGARAGLNALTVAYGAALVDRAILDAVCRVLEIDFATAIRANVPRIDAALAPDLRDFAFDSFLATLEPASALAARHTVGLLDPITAAQVQDRPGDDLPVALTEIVARYGHRFFKIKLSGRPKDDIERLAHIAAVLDPLRQYAVTLDGNEQFQSVDAIVEFWRAVGGQPRLARLSGATLYLEQPLPREIALSTDVAALAPTKPLVIDESDATYDAFPLARQRGYAGVSSKSCKGIYKSIVNTARCAYGRHARPPFMTAEDLTAQAGLALQQDCALAGLIGVAHVERNGHHYVAGFDGQHAPADEQRAFAEAHPDLYETTPNGTRVLIRNGTIEMSSLRTPGFASGALPEIASLAPLRVAPLATS